MASPTRAQQSRAATARPQINGHDGGILSVDTSQVSPDLELMWATEQVLGADFRENVRLQMSQRGFVPVLVGDMPSEAPPLFPGEKREEHALIRRGGMVLMKRERRVGQAERDELRQQDAEALRSVSRDFEESIQASDGLERMRDSGVTERVQRSGGKPGSGFPE